MRRSIVQKKASFFVLSDLRFDGGDFILFEREIYIFTFVSSFFLSFFIACSSLSSISIEFERWFEREERERESEPSV